MHISVKGSPLYGYTGGKAFDTAKPTVIFIHGVLNDHSVWALQSRYMANHGWNILAIDLPGHCRSGGDAPASVEQAADAIGALLDAAGVQRAALVGHSWGSLIALEAAAQLKHRISHLVLAGIVFPMRVSPALIEASLNDPEKAMRMVHVLSRSALAAPPSALGPGTWVFGAGMALGRRVLRSNTAINVFHRGFVACDSYTNGESAMADIACPVLFILGTQDQMASPKAAQVLIETARAAGKMVQVTRLPVGHNQMTEAPEQMLLAIRDFLALSPFDNT